MGQPLILITAASVRRVILISFPHVEGPTTVDDPATGRLDRAPVSVHARTRLEEERLLIRAADGHELEPVVLRVGMVYGHGVLMIEAARWLARRRLLAVWSEPTWIQLISVPDFLAATTAAVLQSGVHGTYHLGDEHPVTLQEFLDVATATWGLARPWRLPVWSIQAAAGLCELAAFLGHKPAPLTRDFIRIGRVPYWGDTGRMRTELLPELRYPRLEDGLATLEDRHEGAFVEGV